VGKNIFIHFKPFLLFKLEKIFKERPMSGQVKN